MFSHRWVWAGQRRSCKIWDCLVELCNLNPQAGTWGKKWPQTPKIRDSWDAVWNFLTPSRDFVFEWIPQHVVVFRFHTITQAVAQNDPKSTVTFNVTWGPSGPHSTLPTFSNPFAQQMEPLHWTVKHTLYELIVWQSHRKTLFAVTFCRKTQSCEKHFEKFHHFLNMEVIEFDG